MRFFSRACLASGTLVVILFLGGCQGLGTSPTGGNSSTVTVTLAGTGSGTVTSSPAGINCGTTCTADFSSGPITLTATPTTGNAFMGWSGACTGTGSCSIPAGSTATATATFAVAKPSKVTVVLAGSGTGTVTSAPAGINCGTTCTADFANGAVTLTATPGTSFVFGGWSGGGCSGTGACTIAAGSTVTVTATFSATLNSINHIIILLQENRSFDHYFSEMNTYRQNNGYPAVVDAPPASVDVAPTNASNPTFDRTGAISRFHLETMCVENPSPFWDDGHVDFNLDNPTSTNPLNNGFVWDAANMAMNSGEVDTVGQRVMGYYDSGDLPFYYFMASNFAMSDRWFAPVMSRTQPNRMYMMAATSDGHVFPLSGGAKSSRTTIFEELQRKGVTWKFYVPGGSPTLVDATEMSMFTYGTVHPENFVDSDTFASDAANGTLPQVAYIAEGQGTDEHPAEPGVPGGSVQGGSNYVENHYVLPLLNSPSWKDSVFILAFDEGGGFYDHVPAQKTVAPDAVPPSDLTASNICFGVPSSPTNTCGFNYTGYRVPMMVISPFARKNFVSHTVADHTAMLKLIETRFGVSSLTARDAAQIDMTEFFDFVNAPWMTPPTPPDQPAPGPCYLDHLP